MDYELKIIPKKEISEKEISNFFKLKQQIWNYNIREQINWWKNNSEEDYYICGLRKKNIFFAFLRMRKRNILLNKKKINCFCITEVCVAKDCQGRGWGKKLIQESKKFIKKKNIPVYLICSNNQKNFYKKCKFELAKNFNINSNIKNYDTNQICCFFFNLKIDNKQITLYGNSF